MLGVGSEFNNNQTGTDLLTVASGNNSFNPNNNDLVGNSDYYIAFDLQQIETYFIEIANGLCTVCPPQCADMEVVPNPPLTQNCDDGLDIALVIDESGFSKWI